MRIFLRILLVFLIMLLTVIPLLEGFLFFFGDELKGYAEQRIRENFAARIKVGRIEYSVLTSFPDITLKLSDIAVNDYSLVTTDQLFEADQLLLVFNLWDMLGKNYRIQEMQLRNATLNLFVDDNNKDNYHIFRDKKGTDTTSLTFDLKKIRLDNFTFNYENELKEQDISFDIKHAEATGSFTEETFTTSVSSSIYARRFYLGDVNYLDAKPVTLTTRLSVNMKDDHYRIDESNIQISDILLVGGGELRIKDDHTDVDVNLKGKDLSIKSFLSLLPDSFRKDLEGLSSEGEFYFSTRLKGELSKESDPGIHMDFGVKDVTITNANMPVPLEKVSMQGIFINKHNGDTTISSLEVKNFSAVMSGRELRGEFKLTNLDDPFLHARIRTDISLEAVQKFMNPEEVESMSGDVGLDVEFAGLLDDLRSSATVAQTSSQGSISLKNVELKLKDKNTRLEKVNGLFHFDLNDLDIDTLSGLLSGNDFMVKGSMKNFLPFLLLERQRMTISGTLNSNRMDLAKLVIPQTGNTDGSRNSTGINSIKLDLKLGIKSLQFHRFKAQELSGTVLYADGKLSTDDLKFNAMSGKYEIKGSLVKQAKTVLTQADIKCAGINISELFDQCENFGQTEITSMNIHGMLTAGIQFSGVWTENLDPIMDKMQATADLKIVNGEIKDYKPLEKMSAFIELIELKNLRFSTLQNRIEVRNKVITIPQMEMSTNALNLTTAGTHTFDNVMDYRFKIKLADLLAKKIKARKKEQPEEELFFEETPKGTNVYIAMQGTPDNLKFRYDRESVGKKIGQDLKTEKQTVKELIKDELKGKQKDKPKEKPVPKDDGVDFEEDMP